MREKRQLKSDDARRVALGYPSLRFVNYGIAEKYLYVLYQPETRLHKIGVTTNLSVRLHGAANGMSYVRLVRVWRGAAAQVLRAEKWLFRTLADCRTRNHQTSDGYMEWFRLDKQAVRSLTDVLDMWQAS